MQPRFEWDGRKVRSNLAKHGVSFEEARSVFADVNARTIHDPDHSVEEDRFVMVGFSEHGRLITVVHTDRENAIRIIGARRSTGREAEDYGKDKA